MFAVIQFDIAGKRVLDLFAGSGALGIEALSRGAEFAVFVDERAQSVAVVKENLAKARLAEKARVIKSDYAGALHILQGGEFSLIFMDPPYQGGYYEKALAAIGEYGLLAADGIVVLEKDESLNLEIPPYYVHYKEKRYGGTALVYLKKA